jgi:hypothetical protein
MCIVLLPPGANPIEVNKYNISYHIISYHKQAINGIQYQDSLIRFFIASVCYLTMLLIPGKHVASFTNK